MSAITTRFDGIDCHVSRSGYTGEDGFEISSRRRACARTCEPLLAEPSVKPIGLGARDSLRLEAGLLLYGHDIDTTTSPVEADADLAISKRRRAGGRLSRRRAHPARTAHGAARMRVGIKPDGRAPAREGTEIIAADGATIGKVTSGGFGPTSTAPIAMGYVEKRIRRARHGGR